MCIETESSFWRSSLKTDFLPLYINLRHRSCSLFILLFTARLWDIHIRRQQQKWEFKKAFIRNFLFDKSMHGATRVNSCTFPLTFIQMFECDIQNKCFHQIILMITFHCASFWWQRFQHVLLCRLYYSIINNTYQDLIPFCYH